MRTIRGYLYSPEQLAAIGKAHEQVERNVNYVHYGINEDQQRRKYTSTGDFRSPAPLCGNASYLADYVGDVTCPICLAIVEGKPAYL